MFWAFFALYYSIGLFVWRFVTDVEGRPLPFWHAPIVALVWPVLFVLGWDE